MDRITIADLEVNYHVGVPDWERRKPQRLLLTVELLRDFSAAALNDDLTQTIDYFAVSQHLQTYGKGRNWKLIEKLAVDLAQVMLAQFAADKVAVEVKKFVLAETRYVSVRVERERKMVQGPTRSGTGTA
jgi:dihydroneopterin aldolase